jgi:hypothetical protein
MIGKTQPWHHTGLDPGSGTPLRDSVIHVFDLRDRLGESWHRLGEAGPAISEGCLESETADDSNIYLLVEQRPQRAIGERTLEDRVGNAGPRSRNLTDPSVAENLSLSTEQCFDIVDEDPVDNVVDGVVVPRLGAIDSKRRRELTGQIHDSAAHGVVEPYAVSQCPPRPVAPPDMPRIFMHYLEV